MVRVSGGGRLEGDTEKDNRPMWRKREHKSSPNRALACSSCLVFSMVLPELIERDST